VGNPLSAPAPKLAVEGLLVRRAGRIVVDVPDLRIAPAEVLTVVGPNGAGKTTLLVHLALLERPTQGTVRFEGVPVRSRVLSLRRRMAVVFQDPLLLDRSVRANVEVGLRLRGIPAAERRARVNRWLGAFAIDHLAHRSARTLSGGEAQRVALARAFALEPEVLLLDEPFSALDAPTRAAITNDLAGALAATRTTTVLVTHDHDEAARLGNRVAVMIGGRIRQVGTPAAVFGAPADEAVAAFVGIETIVEAVVSARSDGLVLLHAAGHAIEALDPDAAFDRALVCLRPEDVSLALSPLPGPEGGTPGSARNRLSGRVSRVVPSGADARVEVNCGFPLVARITRRSLDELALEPGRPVIATFKATAVHLIPK
jgi:tungstate transport system ATP-binding protein